MPHNVPSTISTEQSNEFSMPFIDSTVIHRTKPQEILDNLIKSLRQTTKLHEIRDYLDQKILDLQNSSSKYFMIFHAKMYFHFYATE